MGLVSVAVLGAVAFASGCSSDSDSGSGTSADAGQAGAPNDAEAGTDSGGTSQGVGEAGAASIAFKGDSGTLWLADGYDTVYTLDTANGAVKKAYSFGSSFQLGVIAGGVDSALVRTEGPRFALVSRDGTKQVAAINSFDSDTVPVSAAGLLFTFEPTVSAVDASTAAVTETNIVPPVGGLDRMYFTAASSTTLFGIAAATPSDVDGGLIRYDVATKTATATRISAENTFADPTFTRAAAGAHGYYMLTVAPGDTVAGGGARRLIHFSDDGSFDNDATLEIKGDIYDAVAASDDAVWIFYSASGQVQRLDPETLSPIDKTTLAVSGEGQSGRGIVYGGGAAWVYGVGGGEKGLVRVSEKDLSQLVISLPADAGATYVGFGPASLGVQPL
jgi:hypothetical protein